MHDFLSDLHMDIVHKACEARSLTHQGRVEGTTAHVY